MSGLDVVVNYTSPAEVCLQPALDAANLGSLNNLKAVSESQLQSIQQLVAMWNMDVMYEGMQGVVCPCCIMHHLTCRNHQSCISVNGHGSECVVCSCRSKRWGISTTELADI